MFTNFIIAFADYLPKLLLLNFAFKKMSISSLQTQMSTRQAVKIANPKKLRSRKPNNGPKRNLLGLLLQMFKFYQREIRIFTQLTSRSVVRKMIHATVSCRKKIE